MLCRFCYKLWRRQARIRRSKHLMKGLNPKRCTVNRFKAPSAVASSHSFLWRAAQKAPPKGEIGILSCSYDEEVLATKVHPELLEAEKLPHTSDEKDFGKIVIAR